jgi:hypothetical protein
VSHTDGTTQSGQSQTDTGGDDRVSLDHGLALTGEREGTKCQEECKKLFHKASFGQNLRFWVPSTVSSESVRLA